MFLLRSLNLVLRCSNVIETQEGFFERMEFLSQWLTRAFSQVIKILGGYQFLPESTTCGLWHRSYLVAIHLPISVHQELDRFSLFRRQNGYNFVQRRTAVHESHVHSWLSPASEHIASLPANHHHILNSKLLDLKLQIARYFSSYMSCTCCVARSLCL